MFFILAVNCGHPGIPRHGNISESGFTYEKVVSFSCHRYYELRGDSTRQCQADGKWSGEQPTCVPSKYVHHCQESDLIHFRSLASARSYIIEFIHSLYITV